MTVIKIEFEDLEGRDYALQWAMKALTSLSTRPGVYSAPVRDGNGNTIGTVEMCEVLVPLISSSAGIYIPQEFVETYGDNIAGKDHFKEDISILLEGPDHPDYWDAWMNLLESATFYMDGYLWRPYEEEGDLYALLVDDEVDDA